MSKKKQTYEIGRDAGTGRFIPVEKAKKLGNKAVVETIKKNKK